MTETGVTLDRNTLLTWMQIVKNFTKGSVIQEWSNVLFFNGRMYAQGADLAVSRLMPITHGDPHQDISLLYPAEELYKFVKSCKSDLTFGDSGNVISGRSKVKFPQLKTQPELRFGISDDSVWETNIGEPLSVSLFLRALTAVEKFASQNDARIFFNGAHWTSRFIECCDGSGICRVFGDFKIPDIVLSSNHFDTVKLALKAHEEEGSFFVSVENNKITMRFHKSKAVYIFSSVDTKYPDTDKVFPNMSNPDCQVSVNLKQLEGLVDQSLIFFNKIISIKASESISELSITTPDLSGQSGFQGNVDAIVRGNVNASYNPILIKDALDSFAKLDSRETVDILFSGVNTPFCIEKKDDYAIVIMPFRT